VRRDAAVLGPSCIMPLSLYQAHNLKVVSSNLAPATKLARCLNEIAGFCLSGRVRVQNRVRAVSAKRCPSVSFCVRFGRFQTTTALLVPLRVLAFWQSQGDCSKPPADPTGTHPSPPPACRVALRGWMGPSCGLCFSPRYSATCVATNRSRPIPRNKSEPLWEDPSFFSCPTMFLGGELSQTSLEVDESQPHVWRKCQSYGVGWCLGLAWLRPVSVWMEIANANRHPVSAARSCGKQSPGGPPDPYDVRHAD